MDRQCVSCGGFCKKSGCERENVKPEQEPVGRFAKFSDGIWKEVTDGSAGQPLYTAPPPCQTCEALARTVMMDQMGKA